MLASGLQRATADFRRNVTTAAAQAFMPTTRKKILQHLTHILRGWPSLMAEQQMRRFKGCQLQQQELAVAHPPNSNQKRKNWKEQAVVLDQ
uniref:Uncharacterized protein n=1 Tax=Nothobranchius rachovii TaxID=451742 RepID=A0A1A8RM96_9TELE